MTPQQHVELLEFLRDEIRAIHDVCDQAHVPRADGEEPLSLCQRVERLSNAYVSLMMAQDAVRKAMSR